jgi:hypothetical protein
MVLVARLARPLARRDIPAASPSKVLYNVDKYPSEQTRGSCSCDLAARTAPRRRAAPAWLSPSLAGWRRLAPGWHRKQPLLVLV